MMMLMVICCLVGAVIGLRFKVLAFVPVICIALAIVGIGEIARGDGLWRLLLAIILTSTSVQLGYLGALGFLLVKHREIRTRQSRVSLPTTLKPNI
jgi:hypothetical protein